MPSPFVETVRTYFRQWIFLIPAVLLGWLICLWSMDRWSAVNLLVFGGMCGACLGLHLKEQLARPQAVLVPHFKRRHVQVAALFAGLALIPVGLLFAYLGVEPLGHGLSLLAAAFVCVGAASYYFSPLGFVFAGLVSVLAILIDLLRTRGTFLLESSPVSTGILIGVTLCIAVLWIDRMARLREDSLEYAWRPILRGWDVTAARKRALKSEGGFVDAAPFTRGLARFAERHFDRLRGGAEIGRRGRLFLFSVGFGLSRYPLREVAFIVPACIAASCGYASGAQLLAWGAMGFMCSLVSLIAEWSRSRECLAYSLLFPTTRREWARQVLLSLACTYLWCWAVAATMLIAAMHLDSQLVDWERMLPMIVLLGAYGLAIFGLLLRVRIAAARGHLFQFVAAVSVALTMFCYVILSEFGVRAGVPPLSFAAIIVVCLGTGMELLLLSYRRLCAADL